MTKHHQPSRRKFLMQGASVVSLAMLPAHVRSFANSETQRLATTRIACQQYPWMTLMARDGASWDNSLTRSLQMVVDSGCLDFEPMLETPKQASHLLAALKSKQINSYSVYVNSILHDARKVPEQLDNILAVADAIQPYGVKIITTNPAPISWDTPKDKSDDELATQVAALNELGGALKQKGIVLAYHNHDAEMRHGAREFHHMMRASSADKVKLCLDAQWIYRGVGNSSLALMDIVDMYAARVVSVHLRQSFRGTWSETFSQGDIDYASILQRLRAEHRPMHFVLEQAVEATSPHTLNAIQAHRQSLAYASTLIGSEQ
ncbi:sugar phosphate isomerase/epimerase family protein [Glaciecola siphonariae]|uniref:Sugar phosphate isomerase/epimerase family protein n=1 Tax=Glaciecola siphonariae TaxID=521012 RepID=A0ABV9LSZ9_9ALTE